MGDHLSVRFEAKGRLLKVSWLDVWSGARGVNIRLISFAPRHRNHLGHTNAIRRVAKMTIPKTPIPIIAHPKSS